MKKIATSLIALLLAFTIYYLTIGSDKLVKEMKAQVNTEINRVAKNGFSIQNREIKPKEEHMELNFNDPKKIVTFFKTQGSEVTLEDAKALKGLKIGLDIKYLNDSYSAVSVDAYPLNLPSSLTKVENMSENDKKFIQQLNAMLKRKDLLLHVDFNKLLSSFKGYVKDINQTLTLDKQVKITLKGSTFKGTLEKDRIHTVTQKIKSMSIGLGEELTAFLSNMQSTYTLTGQTLYDSNYQYQIEKIDVKTKHAQNNFTLHIENMAGKNIVAVKQNLASDKIRTTVDSIEIADNMKKSKLSGITFSFNISSLDMNILKELETLDASSKDERKRLLQGLISKGVTIEVPLFEVKKIVYLKKNIDGFSLVSTFGIDKNANIVAIQANPFSMLGAVNAKTKIILSDTLFALIAQQPRVMMLAMLIQPKVVNGKKIYEIELKKGKLTVNGKPVM